MKEIKNMNEEICLMTVLNSFDSNTFVVISNENVNNKISLDCLVDNNSSSNSYNELSDKILYMGSIKDIINEDYLELKNKFIAKNYRNEPLPIRISIDNYGRIIYKIIVKVMI